MSVTFWIYFWCHFLMSVQVLLFACHEVNLVCAIGWQFDGGSVNFWNFDLRFFTTWRAKLFKSTSPVKTLENLNRSSCMRFLRRRKMVNGFNKIAFNDGDFYIFTSMKSVHPSMNEIRTPNYRKLAKSDARDHLKLFILIWMVPKVTEAR